MVGECALILLLPKIWGPSFYFYVLDAISSASALCLFKKFPLSAVLQLFWLGAVPTRSHPEISLVLYNPTALFPNPRAAAARPATELQSSGRPRGALTPLPAARAAQAPLAPAGGSVPASRGAKVGGSARLRGSWCFINRHCVVSPSPPPGLGCSACHCHGQSLQLHQVAASLSRYCPPARTSPGPSFLSVCPPIHPPLRPLTLQAPAGAFYVLRHRRRNRRCTGGVFSRSRSSLRSQISALRLDFAV